MSKYSLTHLGDRALERELAMAASRHRDTGANLIAHIAEFDARKLYLPAAYPSMYAYCLDRLNFSEDAAFKRIRAGRAARRFPAIFAMLADGRLHLSAVVLLAPHLTRENAGSLLAAAAQRSKAEVEQLLAERFPRPDVPAGIEPLALSCAGTADEFRQLAPGPVLASAASVQVAPGPVRDPASDASRQVAPGPVGDLAIATCAQLAPGPVAGNVGTHAEAPAAVPGEPLIPPAPFASPGPAAPHARLAPLSPGRFALQVTLDESTRRKLEYARSLLGHTPAGRDLPALLDRALDALIEQLEKQKFAATSRPRKRASRASANPRHVPANVKRAVWRRDQGQCTFVSESGRRCPEKCRLEYDHAEPVARGGRASVEGIRLRCRAHNQYAAECAFGAGFMDEKRRAAQRGATDRRAAKARAAVGRQPAAGRNRQDRDLVLARSRGTLTGAPRATAANLADPDPNG